MKLLIKSELMHFQVSVWPIHGHFREVTQEIQSQIHFLSVKNLSSHIVSNKKEWSRNHGTSFSIFTQPRTHFFHFHAITQIRKGFSRDHTHQKDLSRIAHACQFHAFFLHFPILTNFGRNQFRKKQNVCISQNVYFSTEFSYKRNVYPVKVLTGGLMDEENGKISF